MSQTKKKKKEKRDWNVESEQLRTEMKKTKEKEHQKKLLIIEKANFASK